MYIYRRTHCNIGKTRAPTSAKDKMSCQINFDPTCHKPITNQPTNLVARFVQSAADCKIVVART